MLACVTNDMPGVKSCRRHGFHLETCERETCKGCAPREANKGCLCWTCWERLLDVTTQWPVFAATVVGLDRVMTPEMSGGRGLDKNRIPLPQTWLDVNEAESFLMTFTQAGGDVEAWVSTVDGAKDSINFVISAERAFRSHPLEEQPHKAPQVACWECKKRTLVWNPPKFFGDEVHVQCLDPECGYTMPQSAFELLAQIEERKEKSA